MSMQQQDRFAVARENITSFCSDNPKAISLLQHSTICCDIKERLIQTINSKFRTSQNKE
jgi:hypothetical protein